jgi:hypothetical protein
VTSIYICARMRMHQGNLLQSKREKVGLDGASAYGRRGRDRGREK